MKSFNKIATAMALLGSATASHTVMAQTMNNSSWYIAPTIDAFNPDDKFGVTNNGKGLGVRFGKPISPKFDLQLGPTFARASQADRKSVV